MKNFTEANTNELLNKIVETAVREAVKLQVAANKEYDKQKALADAVQPFDFTAKQRLMDGVHAICEVLWKIFGGYPYEHFQAIEEIVAVNKSKILGFDCQDYAELYMSALDKS